MPFLKKYVILNHWKITDDLYVVQTNDPFAHFSTAVLSQKRTLSSVSNNLFTQMIQTIDYAVNGDANTNMRTVWHTCKLLDIDPELDTINTQYEKPYK